MNILVLGSDIAGSAREATERQEATGEHEPQDADTIMLIHIPADRHKVFGISIMRDNWVNIPGYGVMKINAGLQLAGPKLVVATVESLLHTHIDHYVMTDFGGFKAFVDAVGGIDVDVPVPFTSTVPYTATFETQHTFTKGVNRLDGEAALQFVRERHAFPDGDYQRVRNQQAFVRAMMALILSSGRARDAVNAIALIALASPVLTVDSGFDPTAMAALAYALRGTDPAAAVFFTLPTAGTGFSAGGQSIVLPDYGGIEEVAAALAADGLDDYAAAHGL
ncbi:LCP family protein [Sinomonas sp. ASV322]|uniref:LCP family protein n=1 Tax=Sinomonas sp. ASV322 TaxID=3041920 RepID=UPI0027DB2B89|nr:LCP family protein [Sinomonas sp. ASV322]MDQ4501500.1 LCP family protein [Sinomonas sp. ASV322]